ncbi:ATPase or kinase [Caldanaerobacter subterraneus subsp. pacificus DSM 12653]|uniref:ATPase or kinase n=1 Tax=Caldanaerobacter subterraneus subsp. pacificus DSM 12653 TaxID=391606 RepID=A0A0F5PP34_9THEO|nr:ATPase or kinase [Caldanaerobacter subterraneus subsp. pacificus DSM 12653]
MLIEKGEEEDLRIITLNAFGKRYEELLKEMD